ncbi:zinc-ribbon domain-containing protein [Aliidiomarina indica]|uniref:zinc-ribbon domain-containing protein n=1 Tax=Aliidiomarina indica TaxID=2749147 RepID=UPI00188F2FB8|nr:zinc ribbon domain-containing protein [Aliidiomarina indica]
MAIISCPGCGKKVSDKAATCEHCGFMLSAHDSESLVRKSRLQRSQQLSRLVSQQMLAILLFIAGIGAFFYDWGNTGIGPWVPYIGGSVAAISFVWYLITRGRIYMLKKQR